MTVWPACSISTDTRRRLSRESSDVQVSQSQAIEGTPVDVPVPRKVSFMADQKLIIFHFSFDSFHLSLTHSVTGVQPSGCYLRKRQAKARTLTANRWHQNGK